MQSTPTWSLEWLYEMTVDAKDPSSTGADETDHVVLIVVHFVCRVADGEVCWFHAVRHWYTAVDLDSIDTTSDTRLNFNNKPHINDPPEIAGTHDWPVHGLMDYLYNFFSSSDYFLNNQLHSHYAINELATRQLKAYVKFFLSYCFVQD